LISIDSVKTGELLDGAPMPERFGYILEIDGGQRECADRGELLCCIGDRRRARLELIRAVADDLDEQAAAVDVEEWSRKLTAVPNDAGCAGHHPSSAR
jgi:hypothetical protein